MAQIIDAKSFPFTFHGKVYKVNWSNPLPRDQWDHFFSEMEYLGYLDEEPENPLTLFKAKLKWVRYMDKTFGISLIGNYIVEVYEITEKGG